jgi:hypothetical protein
MPFDGVLAAASERAFLYGRPVAGNSRVPPDAWFLVDAAGAVMGRVPSFEADASAGPRFGPPFGRYTTRNRLPAWAAARGAHVLLWDVEGRLYEWAPGDAATGPDARTPRFAPPAPRQPTLRGARVEQGHTSNPRDDWPVPGLTVRSTELLVEDGSFGGTTGMFPAPALHAEEGATVVLVDSALTHGGGLLERGSTALLVRCRSGGAWSLGPGCHLLLLACQVPPGATFRLAPGATVVADGLVLEPDPGAPAAAAGGVVTLRVAR